MLEDLSEASLTDSPEPVRSACWAASLGGCVDKMSREHLVSQSMWSQVVDVHGLSWCRDMPKRIGIASLTQKVLCREHNSRLSPVDAAGKKAFDAFGEAADLAYRRNKQLPHRRWKRRMLQIDGPRLERWFLKTTINLVIAQESQLRWTLTGSAIRDVPADFVRTAFGVTTLSKPMGLYYVSRTGEKVTVRDTMTFAPLIQSANLVGGLFTFRGFRFLLYFGTEPLPQPFILPGLDMPEWREGFAAHHISHHQWKIGRHLSHRIEYGWPEAEPSTNGLV